MQEANKIKIAIITSTYWKLDGSTKDHLADTLSSIASQTYPHYKVFLIGDDYEKKDELIELSKIIDKDKIYVENLPVAIERIKYSGRELWACGGVNAQNRGIAQALSEGFDYICQLDHDDVMFPDHLDVVVKGIKDTGSAFITTKCNFLPEIETDELYTPFIPQAGKIFKAGVCFSHRRYSMFYRSPEEVKEAYGYIYAGDADMWNRIKAQMKRDDEHGIFINKTTCRKIGGKVPINNPEIVKR